MRSLERWESTTRSYASLSGEAASNNSARVAAAARLGVTAEDIATIARVATIGDVDANVAKVSAGERHIPVRAVLESEARQDLDALRNLQIPTGSEQTTRLAAVADMSFEGGPGRIDRFDRERRETIRADLRDGATLGQALDATAKLPTLEALPSGVRQAEYGDAEAFNDLFGGFIAAMLAGVGLMFGVLVLLFKSLFKPTSMLVTSTLSTMRRQE